MLKMVLLFLSFLPLDKFFTGIQPDQFVAKVIGIKDGDTIEVLYENKPIVIRLEHIDCPEIKKGQPFGETAKKFTSDLCFGQMVTVISHKNFDRYKRLIAVVINEQKQNVNKELVKAGLAWHFKKYSTDVEYDQLERIARQKKTGIWSDPSPIAPWDWRKPKKKSN